MTHASIALRLKNHMASRAISGVELAVRSNVKPSFIYDILSGKSANPSTVKLARVAGALGISIAELVEPPENRVSLSAPAASEYIAVPLLQAGWQGVEPVPLPPHGEPYYFRRSWIRECLHAVPENLRMAFVRGDNMAPTLLPGDLILLDITHTLPASPGVFAVHDGIGLIAQRLECADENQTVLRVQSDNPNYSPYALPAGEITIVGRVIWFSRGI